MRALLSRLSARDPERARAYAEAHGIGAVADSYKALPSSAHLEWTLKSVQAGKPVLCEKPFAMDAREACAIVHVAKVAGVPKALIAEGAIGRPAHARVRSTELSSDS